MKNCFAIIFGVLVLISCGTKETTVDDSGRDDATINSGNMVGEPDPLIFLNHP